jgi:hypothetical protein
VDKFQTLNHPEIDEDGVQRYDVFRVPELQSPGKKRYVPVVRNLTREEADEFVAKNGEWED